MHDFVEEMFNVARENLSFPFFPVAVKFGLSGTWINIGLPVFAAMNRKPKDECATQNFYDQESNMMLRLKTTKLLEVMAKEAKEFPFHGNT